VEDKLYRAIGAIWTDLFAAPDQDLDTCLHRHLVVLSPRPRAP
jgi:hypothetical protein